MASKKTHLTIARGYLDDADAAYAIAIANRNRDYDMDLAKATALATLAFAHFAAADHPDRAETGGNTDDTRF